MNLADIITKCYILALIIRDDGERLLLGDGAYEFKDSQQHFIANTYANDVVELQGTDGQMLAGQVRRTATQTFAGYIGDATFSKQKVEEARRDFLMFFRKKHYYTAVYVFSDGTAIQRDRGYIVNAPSAPELYQRFPEWSVGLNFEDPNYYEYAEDDLGHEIAAHKVELELSTAMSGGLIWDGDGAVSDDLSYVGTEIQGEGKNFQLADTGTATLKSASLLGDTEQQTYSGKNLFGGLTEYYVSDCTYTLVNNILTITPSDTTHNTGVGFLLGTKIPSGSTVHLSCANSIGSATQLRDSSNTIVANFGNGIDTTRTLSGTSERIVFNWMSTGSTTPFTVNLSTLQLELGSAKTSYEPYVGGTASPNPDYPQEVETVTGEQVVKIEGKNLCSSTSVPVATQIYFNFNKGSLDAGTYTLSATLNEATQNNSVYLVLDGAGVYIGATMSGSANQKNVCHFTLTQANIEAINNSSQALLRLYKAGASFVNPTDAQLELGSSATAYEPYQGQSKTVNLGKNLAYTGWAQDFVTRINSSTLASLETKDNRECLKWKANAGYGSYDTGYMFKVPFQENAQYTFSMDIYTENASNKCNLAIEYTDGTYTSINESYGAVKNTWSHISFTSTSGKTIKYLRAFYWSENAYIDLNTFQVEKGTQATTYAPYFTPIELAKIGTYQDRIYKTDGKWYVEKQVGKVVFDGTENWTSQGGGAPYTIDMPDFDRNTNEVRAISDNFLGVKYNANWNDYSSLITSNSSNDTVSRFKFRYTAITSLADWKTWLASNPTTVYYALATPTDTEITNTALIAQLERLRHAHTYADTTNFSITATSPNLPAFLKVVAFGDDAIPQGGYVWEDGGAGGATTITVDGVDNAQPIWTVVGPATNPSLTNITTGESIQWTGVVPNGQTLVVNMADMTASLSGANVFEFISGSWITLQAGNNRVSYSATAATGIATLEWNGVVG